MIHETIKSASYDEILPFNGDAPIIMMRIFYIQFGL